MIMPPPNWLPLLFLIVVGANSLWRITQLKAANVDAIAFGGHGLKALLERAFGLLVTVAGVFAIVFANDPAIARDAGEFSFLETPILAWIGALLGTGGALLVAFAQFGMRASWRIGIREDEQSALVTTGLYRLSRNPIYLGMAAMQIGLFLIAPNAFTFAVLGAGLVAMSVQIRLEEEHLRRVHGAAFERYCERTRRWV
jgi:protein-S-isoprenylcysteine O-methyltransferase Ste14